MKVKRFELVKAIDKLKSVVQKNDANPALAGILVSNGSLIASNTEITIEVKLEDSRGETFIIPMRAFDLIKNLPEGEIEIIENEKHMVTIQMDKIKNSYQSFPAENFSYKKEIPEDNGTKLPGKQLMEALSRVMYAAADKAVNQMGGIYFETEEGKLNIVALDGHVMAWDVLDVEGVAEDLKLTVPKATIKKLVSLGIMDDVNLTYDRFCAVFKNEEYAIFTRLIDGQYYKFRNMFRDEVTESVETDRRTLAGALTRAKLCIEENRAVIFQIKNQELRMSIEDKHTNYSEVLPVTSSMAKPIRIGFDSRLMLETIKVHTDDDISMKFLGPRAPVFMTSKSLKLKTLVLPVAIH